MAQDISNATIAELLAEVVGPALTMGVVGSLVLFLAEVLYVGQYQASLVWVLLCFVFGSVLIARISMTGGISERAGLYGCILGLLVWIALQRYVIYSMDSPVETWGWLINAGLVFVIWWSAHQLTRDSTTLDERASASGTGVLQELGLDHAPGAEASGDAPAEEPDSRAARPGERRAKRKRRKKAPSPNFTDWLRQYDAYQEQRKKLPHTPGVWIAYFSLAALPLFGVGQTLIPVEDVGRRRYAFWLLTVYVACGVGLLLMTSFLGMRRYLRQRKVKMPAPLGIVWLSTGLGFAAVLLLAAMLVPRPSAEFPLFTLPWRAHSVDRSASAYAKRSNDAGKDDGRSGERKDDSTDKNDRTPGGNAQSKDPQSQGKGAAKGNEPSQAQDDASKQNSSAPNRAQDSAPQPQPFEPPAMGSWSLEPLKPLVIGLFVVAIAFVVLRSVLSFLAHFTGWAKSLLQAFGRLGDALRALLNPARRRRPPREIPSVPFAQMADPFQAGRARDWTTEELIRHSFRALEAWARERELPREPGETPAEFTRRVSELEPRLEAPAAVLADVYAALAYARATPDDECRKQLWTLWEILRG